jgi:hypothetical protein
VGILLKQPSVQGPAGCPPGECAEGQDGPETESGEHVTDEEYGRRG